MPGFLARYAERARSALSPAHSRLRARRGARLGAASWASSILFVGTSGRVFPKDIEGRAAAARVAGHRLRSGGDGRAAGAVARCSSMRHRWLGWADDGSDAARSPNADGELAFTADADAAGASRWRELESRLGSDVRLGAVAARARRRHRAAATQQLRLRRGWPTGDRPRRAGASTCASGFAGEPVKPVAITAGPMQRASSHRQQGEFLSSRPRASRAAWSTRSPPACATRSPQGRRARPR